MDNLDTKTPAQPGMNDLPAQVEALRHLVVSILILVVVISGTFNIYLLRQWRGVTKELAAIRPQVSQMTEVYQKQEAPWMQDILKRFTEYGRSHPAFAPILTKYNLNSAASAGTSPGTTATPRSAAPPKK